MQFTTEEIRAVGGVAALLRWYDPVTVMFSKILLWTARLLVGFLLLGTLLPLLPSGLWWVRIWDFPRLQIAASLGVVAALIGWHARRMSFRREHRLLLAAVALALAYQAMHLARFTPLWPKETPAAAEGQSAAITLIVANVNFKNDRFAEVLETLRKHGADVVFVVEVDAEWADALESLDNHYPHRETVVRGESLGLVLWSKFPLRSAEVRHLVSDRRPSIFATLETPTLGPVRVVGLHPTPPGLRDRSPKGDDESSEPAARDKSETDRASKDESSEPVLPERHDSRLRDAELVLVAREVRSAPDDRWIVMGDLNDVGWSRTTRLFKDLCDLRDPRVGRRLMNTYHAQRPLLRYPLDHIFVSDGLHLISMERVKIPGSDHFAFAASFAPAAEDRARPSASAQDVQEAEEIVEEGAEDAAEEKAEEREAPADRPESP